MREESRGSVHITSNDPHVAPEIDLNFLATERDRREFIDGVDLTRHIVSQPSLSGFQADEVAMSTTMKTREEILEALRNHVETDHHPSGTCRMGGDAESVVDGQMRVRGRGEVARR